jgi:hypothetical protein
MNLLLWACTQPGWRVAQTCPLMHGAGSRGVARGVTGVTGDTSVAEVHPLTEQHVVLSVQGHGCKVARSAWRGHCARTTTFGIAWAGGLISWPRKGLRSNHGWHAVHAVCEPLARTVVRWLAGSRPGNPTMHAHTYSNAKLWLGGWQSSIRLVQPLHDRQQANSGGLLGSLRPCAACLHALGQ